MAKYKFKLEALLKLRHVREEQCKMEIGKIQVEITKLKQEVEKQKSEIGFAYKSQEQELGEGLTGTEARFYPYFIAGKRAHINQVESEIADLEEEVNQKYEALKKLRGDVKVIEEMKEKDHRKYKKELDKKVFNDLEEQTQNWRVFREKEI